MTNDNKTANKRLVDPAGEFIPPDGGYLPLPDSIDGDDQVFPSKKYPCYVGKYFYAVPTNQLGEIQIHPCYCSQLYFYSPTYGWLSIGREGTLGQRLIAMVAQLVAMGESGYVKPD